MKIHNTTVIIPIHKLEGERELKMAKRAIQSVVNQKSELLPDILVVTSALVGPSQFTQLRSAIGDSKVNYVQTLKEGKTDFASMVNFGVSHIKSANFSILEFDDEFTDLYFGYVEKYLKADPKVSILLPIVAETNLDNELLRYSNEVPWVKDFAKEPGTLDHEALLNYAGVNLTGAVINTSQFRAVKGLKSNLPAVFNYEFLLRLSNQDDCRIVSIPKIGYLHKNGRENSLFAQYMKGKDKLSQPEFAYWFETAKKEFEHLEQRLVKSFQA